EEYCIRRDRGEPVEPQVYCQRFPSICRSLFRQIEVDEYIRSNPAFLQTQTPIEWPRIGEELFEFVVVEEIGRGAFARAYLCAQSGVGNRQVVVKVSHGGAVEADTMGGLNHPNIMSVYSVQVDESSHLTGICMPFVGRSTLYDVIDVAFGGGRTPDRAGVILEASRAMMRRGDRYQRLSPTLPIESRADYTTGVLQLGVQIADALAHAHHHEVLHGDLKPSNIVMTVGGTPMLVDFNLAQSRDSANLVTGGTLPYMAPEQIRAMLLGANGDDRVDHRSDIFSLGAILFEMLTGKAASGELPQDVEPILMAGRMLDKHQGGIEPIQSLNPSVSNGTADLISRCLAYDPAQRPSTMLEVRHALHRQLASELHWRRHLRRNPRIAIAIGVGLTTAALAAGTWFLTRPPLRERFMSKAVAAYQAGDNLTAIEYLNSAIKSEPYFGPAYLARGCAQLREYDNENYRGWLDGAFNDLKYANRYSPGPVEKSAQAYCLIRLYEYKAAAFELE
ncbi:MAG: serine/threonine protein kinase, partial [Planctomycetales bacterium]|nr:serine/threonine protein kinase [Planctomycetales bacterium]